MSHANLRRVEADAMRSQIGDLQSHLASLGSTPRVFRPPYGSSNRGVVEYAYGELGMDVVMWSLDTEDWRTETTAQAIIDRILDETRGGEIILMHDIHSKAVPVTRAIVPALRERGFEFVNVSQMIEDMRAHPDPEPGDTAAPTSATSSD
jgi:peptidoglycan/xylan/chitin deacetylase (PgdA/CDA1 family)